MVGAPGTAAGTRYVKRPLAGFDPPGELTRTLAVPAVPAGVVAVILVSLTTVKLVAEFPPMVTPVAPVKPVPESVTDVPPDTAPLAGAIGPPTTNEPNENVPETLIVVVTVLFEVSMTARPLGLEA